jgi:hypothetical protein
MATELLKRDIPALDRSTQLSPLDAIAAPGLAVEVAKPADGVVEELVSAPYQQSVCSAIATTIAGMRTRLPHGETPR